MNGIINFLKPPGMSSNHAVGFFKKLLGQKKVGHAGTLDPGASGVLVILAGRATKLSDYLMNGKKTYIGEIAFGACTDTQDAYGMVSETSDAVITAEMVKSVLPQFIGKAEQTPSRFSAIKVDGKRAYAKARNGEAFEMKPRRVTIERLEFLEQTGENRFLLEVVCSKGTYIRALFEDIGRALGTCAYMSFLERTQSGNFSVESSVTMEEAERMVQDGHVDRLLITIEQALSGFPRADVADAELKRIANGLDGRLASKEKADLDDLYRIYCGGELFGLGHIKDERAKIAINLHEEDGYEKHQV